MPGSKSPFRFELNCKDRLQLREAVVSWKATRRDNFRGGIILLAAVGFANTAIAEFMGTRRETASKWRKRFFNEGMDGLKDRPRIGSPRSVPKLIEVALIGYVVENKAIARENRKLALPYSRYSVQDLHRLLVDDFGEDAPALATIYRIMARAGSACRRRSALKLVVAILVAVIIPAQAMAVD